MKQRGIIVGLAFLSLSLTAVVVWQARLLRAQRTTLAHVETGSADRDASVASSSSDPLRTSEDSRFAPDHNSPARDFPQDVTLGDHAASGETTNWPKFDWRLVESDDYRTYVRNLRDIGCPEETVRDIVTADVMQAFAARRAEVAALRYGESGFHEFDDGADAGFARNRRAVDEAMKAALRELIGTEDLPASTAWAWKAAALEQQLAFLPEDKHRAALEILFHNGDLDVALPRGISGNRLTSAQAEELQLRLATFDRRRNELLQVLTPEEYEQMDMRISWTGDNLRQAMARFQPTEAEFTAIFREWRAHDVRIAGLWAGGEPDPGNKHVFANIERLLGPERYQQYRETWWK
ncbi:MAG: hypothetical protein KIS67_12625 [Verrucomicrobiae bacterium]|nr:hypothetical protein [Verrucomicrobiae bacterium]